MMNDEKIHPKYKLLNNNMQLLCQRHILEGWSDGFVDRDGKALHEFQTTFHSMFWEFFIHQLIKDMNLKIDFSKNRPDFIVKDTSGNDLFYIEAVVSEIKEDGRPEHTRNIDDTLNQIRPIWKLPNFNEIMDEGIVRASNSISKKLKKYDQYKKLAWVDESKPYIVAVSSYAQVNYGNEAHFAILALLYGYYLSKDDGLSYDKVDSILKPNTTSEIDLNIFSDSKYADISAVLFSSKVTLGKLAHLSSSEDMPCTMMDANISVYQDDTEPFFRAVVIDEDNPERLEDGVILFHNPNAKVPLDKDYFRELGVTQMYIENGKLEIDAVSPLLITRFHHQGMKSFEQGLVAEMWMDFNNPYFTIPEMEPIL